MTTTRIGLIADTHDLLRPEARVALAGVAHIIHAGDICNPAVLEQLARIAPVTAVRGNNDCGPWTHGLRGEETPENRRGRPPVPRRPSPVRLPWPISTCRR